MAHKHFCPGCGTVIDAVECDSRDSLDFDHYLHHRCGPCEQGTATTPTQVLAQQEAPGQRDEPDVEAPDYSVVGYAQARVMWEAGEFSDWVEQHGGLPLTIDGATCDTWEEVEDALSDDTWD